MSDQGLYVDIYIAFLLATMICTQCPCTGHEFTRHTPRFTKEQEAIALILRIILCNMMEIDITGSGDTAF